MIIRFLVYLFMNLLQIGRVIKYVISFLAIKS